MASRHSLARLSTCEQKASRLIGSADQNVAVLTSVNRMSAYTCGTHMFPEGDVSRAEGWRRVLKI